MSNLTAFPNGASSFGIPLMGSGVFPDPSGNVYFVDCNMGNDGNEGKDWEHPFLTLTRAFAVSHADIALAAQKHYARRNTIFIAGDYFDEDLVAFPQKTDVIGVGSYDANSQAGIYGNHAPVNTAYGTRFYNCWFKGPAVASPLVTLTSATSGVQFHGCTFSAAAQTTSGILATAHPFLKVIGCRFEGAFATSYISFGAGEAGGAEILGNRMCDAAAAGIIANSGTTTSWGAFIVGNTIEAATLVIDENADLFFIADNRLISLAASTAGYAENIDINVGRAAGNYLTTPNIATVYPVLDTTT